MKPIIKRLKTNLLVISLALSSSPLILALDQDDASEESALPIEELRRFTRLYEQIKNHYVYPIDDTTMLENATKGMLENLDPHSAYLKGKSLARLKETTEGALSGIGIQFETTDHYINVITSLDDSPAARAGIKAGDHILKINGDSIFKLGRDKAQKALAGEAGTTVNLTIEREDNSLINLKLERELINIPSVVHSIAADSVGVIRITEFQSDTGAEVEKAVDDLITQGVDSFVIDLRNNPGGVLQAAIYMADLFLDRGVIVSTRGQAAESHVEYTATEGDMTDNSPIAVIINRGSASASEVFAGAMRDHNRAVIVGEQSFGKGSVQSVVKIDDATSIKLTTALFYAPSGETIQAHGIWPDIPVSYKAAPKPAKRKFSESGLLGHIDAHTPQAIEQHRQQKDKTLKSLMQKDPQLGTAVSYLLATVRLEK